VHHDATILPNGTRRFGYVCGQTDKDLRDIEVRINHRMTSEVHLIDCVEFMRGLPDKCFSLAIVDPPYGIDLGNMNMGIGKSKKASKIQNRKWKPKDWDKNTPTDEYFSQLFRTSTNQIIWGGNYFNLPPCKNFAIWDKEIPEGLSFADCEFAWTSFNKAPKTFRYSAYLDKTNKQHPTQKPVALYRWLLRNYAKPGDTIFDSHMGSQSSRIACHMEGFDFTGCELDPEYFQQGNERYETFLKTYGTPDPTQAIPGQQINLF
jgi:site-specific DNA-methyltransferase (adenine-specific)